MMDPADIMREALNRIIDLSRQQGFSYNHDGTNGHDEGTHHKPGRCRVCVAKKALQDAEFAERLLAIK